MGRKPVARQKVLDAARHIVIERGAGALTYDSLSQASGVTRGGITYHFATKAELLSALITEDLRHWQRIESDNRPTGLPDDIADLIAYLRMHTTKDTDRQSFVAGMMSAVAHDPSVLEPARQFHSGAYDDMECSQKMLHLQLLRMAAFGIFWADFFDCPQLPSELRGQLCELLEHKAMHWSRCDDAALADDEEMT
ncbi:MAG: TetR/AcrR family transcriptional regulator [Pseudomonadota bacterium]